MPKLPGVNHLDAVRALQKAGFRVLRQGKHIIITDGTRKVVIPRNNPVNAITMAGIILDAGLTTPGRLSSALAPPPKAWPGRWVGAMLTRRVSMESPCVTLTRDIHGRHDLNGTPCSRKCEHATRKTPWPTWAHRQGRHQCLAIRV